MDALWRIVDANLNRAREGLRVLEDLARFALDDRDLCESAKQARHALRQTAELLDPGRLRLAAGRDTEGDVGTSVKTAAEGERTGLGDIAAAAAGRATEALRAIEEGAKGLGSAEAARLVERARYDVYTLEQRLVLALGTGKARQWRLCVLITEALCAHHPWEEVARRALEGGADCLQLREKSLADAELTRRAVRLVELARREGKDAASVIINDRADIALTAGADGVHLGQDDLPVRTVRAMASARLLVGVSTHDLDEARRALIDGADYVGVGAMFPTGTKVRDTSGAAYLRDFLAFMNGKRPLPHLAIGGITPDNIGELAAAGCRGVAVSSAVCGAERPEETCRKLLAGLERVQDKGTVHSKQ